MALPTTDPRLIAQLPLTLAETDFENLGQKYRGKVRDTYRQGDRLVLITTDRLSAFDRVLTTLPFKGEVLNRLAAFWFERTKDIVPNHLLDVPDPNVMVAQACEPFPIEVVVRGHLTGSLWRDYESGQRHVYGLDLPEGLRKDQAFERPILTPATKEAVGLHDQPTSAEEIVSSGRASAKDWAQISEAAFALFAEGRRWAASRGLILVDTKYEFGKRGDALLLIDELHTPDSSRYWVAEGAQARFENGEPQVMLDKENIRAWLMREKGFSGQGEPPAIPDEVRLDASRIYLNAYERITGEALPLEVGDVSERIARNLRAG